MTGGPRWVAAAAQESTVAIVTVPNIELLEVGEDWATSTGVFSFTAEDLVSAIGSQDDPAVRTPVLKLGHVDPRFDGQPSLGRVLNLRTSENGQTLIGDLVGVPSWLAGVMASAYPRRSIEGWFEWDTRTGNTWPFVLTGLALLGDSYPAIETLEDVQALWGDTPPPLYPVAQVSAMMASAPPTTHPRQITATRVEAPVKIKTGTVAGHVAAASGVAASVATADVQRAFYNSLEAGQSWWWIRAVMVDPLEVIADDDEGGLYRVPYTVSGDEVTFGEAQAVKVEYVNVAAGALPVAATAPRLPVADGQQIAASFTSPGAAGRPKVLAAATPADPAEGSGTLATPEPESAPTNPQGDRMTDEQRKALRAAYGLPDTATDAEITAAMTATIQQVADAPQTPGDDGNTTTQPEVPATDPAASPAQAPAPSKPTETPAGPTTAETPGVVIPEGMALIDAATLAALQAGVKDAGELVAATRKRELDEYLDGAVRAGKFPKSERPRYERLMASTPTVGREIIDNMAAVLPVQASGVAVDTEATPEESAYPASWGKSVSAARRGAASRVKVMGD